MKGIGRTLVLAVVLAAGGCGQNSAPGGLDLGGAEATGVATLVEDLNDANTSSKKLDGLFVKGAKPADLKKFAKCNFYISGRPAVAGDAATCKVRVDDVAGKTLGEPEWSFQKDGGKWKVKTAPLP